MKYCFHASAGASNCYLDVKISYRNGYVGPLALHLLPLESVAYHRNVASLRVRMFMSAVSALTARIWNYLLKDCFRLV